MRTHGSAYDGVALVGCFVAGGFGATVQPVLATATSGPVMVKRTNKSGGFGARYSVKNI